MFARILHAARQIPLLPVFALVLSIGIVTYAVLHGSGGASDATATPVAVQTAKPTYNGPSVVFSSPADGSTVSNPVSVSMAIGGGLRYQKEGDPPQQPYGHLHIFIDDAPPAAGVTVPVDDTHLDLADGSHQTTLPLLTPGSHTLTAVWTDSQNKTADPVISATITVTVSPPSS